MLRFIHETAGQLQVTSSAKRNDIIFPRRTASVTFGSEWLLLVGRPKGIVERSRGNCLREKSLAICSLFATSIKGCDRHKKPLWLLAASPRWSCW